MSLNDVNITEIRMMKEKYREHQNHYRRHVFYIIEKKLIPMKVLFVYPCAGYFTHSSGY